jgi:hypothetical protein
MQKSPNTLQKSESVEGIRPSYDDLLEKIAIQQQ